MGALKPRSNFKQTPNLYTTALSTEGSWVGFLRPIKQGWLVPTDSITACRSDDKDLTLIAFAFTPRLELELVLGLTQDNSADVVVFPLPISDHVDNPCDPFQDSIRVVLADRLT